MQRRGEKRDNIQQTAHVFRIASNTCLEAYNVDWGKWGLGRGYANEASLEGVPIMFDVIIYIWKTVLKHITGAAWRKF